MALSGPLLSSLSVIVKYAQLLLGSLFVKLRVESSVDVKLVFGVSSPVKFPIPICYLFMDSFCSKLNPAIFGRDMLEF